MAWGKAFRRMEDAVDRRTAAVVSTAALELGSAIVMDNPVGDSESLSEHLEAEKAGREAAKGRGEVYQPTDRYVGGHSRWNWRASVGDLFNLEYDGVDPTGDAAIARMKSTLASVQAGDTVFLSNPVDYAVGREFGKSRKAPRGMVRINAIRWPDMVSRAAKQERRK